jgi:hypothetical protein
MLAGKVFKTIDEVEVDVAKAIEFYNNRRPHDSLDKLTPMEAMNHVGRFKRCWTSWREKAIDNLAASDVPPLEAKSTGHESVV